MAEKDRVNCPFYFKIGACRYGDRCSRLHTKPSISPTLLLSNMITPGVDPQGHPKRRFEELNKYGDIESLADHMVGGNVYVQFREEKHAATALKNLSGRFYAGRPIIVDFSLVTDFRETTCRQYEEDACNRGSCGVNCLGGIGEGIAGAGAVVPTGTEAMKNGLLAAAVTVTVTVEGMMIGITTKVGAGGTGAQVKVEGNVQAGARVAGRTVVPLGKEVWRDVLRLSSGIRRRKRQNVPVKRQNVPVKRQLEAVRTTALWRRETVALVRSSLSRMDMSIDDFYQWFVPYLLAL